MTEEKIAPIEVLGKEQFDNANEGIIPVDKETPTVTPILNIEEVEAIVNKLDQPIQFQKELAAKLKIFLDKRMEDDMQKKGFLNIMGLT